MRIDYCEYSKYCGDKGSEEKSKELWYCPRRHYCPYDKCEFIAKKVAETPAEVVKQEAKKSDAEYYENLIPTIKNLIANGITTWTNIGKALKTNPNPMRTYYYKHGIKFEGLRVQARDVDWDTVVPIVIAKRKEREPWTNIAAELGIQSEMLRVQMRTEYDVY